MSVPRRIVWSGIEDPKNDLCTRRRSGYWDVVHGVDGWVIYDPVQSPAIRRGEVVGDVDRDVAQKRAEEKIRAWESGPPK